MRPLKLKLQAFGPYKNEELIDFTELDDINLFVISGKTGSGKTTIFDAISFALYGSASGEDREDVSLLRSQFADDDLYTSVEFTFNLKGKTYRVLRQLGHQKQGNKTKTGEKYEFYEQVDGKKEVPAVDRQIVSEINAKMESLIGLSQEQFKQIVMLPQGEFRKFLTSDTENKEAILRKLFKTEKYNDLVTHLKEKRDNLQKKYDLEKIKLDHIIMALKTTVFSDEEATELIKLFEKEHYNSSQIIEAAEKEISRLVEAESVERKKLSQAEAAYKKNYNHLVNSKTTNKLFEDKEDLINQLERLKQRTSEINHLRDKLKAAEAALQISVYEESYIKQRQALENKKVEAEDLKVNFEKKVSTHAQLKSEKEKLLKLDLEIERDKKLLEELKRYKKFLDDILNLDGMIKHHQSEFETVKCQLGNLTDGKSVAENELENINEKLEELTEARHHLPQKENERERLLSAYRDIERYLKLEDKLKRKKIELREVEAKLIQFQQAYHLEEAKWYKEQAALLAIKLEEGEPCLVCGSTEHPKKAKQSNDVLTREEINQLKEESESYNRKQQELELRIEQISREISELEKQDEADYLLRPKESLSEIKLQGLKLKEVIQSLKTKGEEITKLKEQRDRLRNKLTIDRASEEDMRKESEEKAQAYHRLLTERDVLIKQIPKDYQNLEKLLSDLKELSEKVSNYQKKKEQVSQEFDQVDKEVTRIKTQKEEIKKRIEQLIQDVDFEKNNFESKLKEAEFHSQTDYLAAKKNQTEIRKLKVELDAYDKEKVEVGTRLKHLNVQLSGKEKVDLTELEKLVEVAHTEQEKQAELTRNMSQIKGAIEQSVKQIKEINQKIEAEETELLILEDLYNMTRGQNDSRISFERYLQIEYLEEIIQSANLRLHDLSNGQYQLVRSERKESYGRQSGLALDINDSYTGQTRDVKSLSGGEKFNTSLALALGMSDVIQSFEGNVSIEMMFIDEGFGSLDQEALTKAIDTLIALQKTGRLIGVISHVEELKAIFPAVLHVEKNREGSSRSYFKVN